MSGIKWTPEQERAIYTRGKNVLVSAAAGSGKTAVLSARIISLTVPENPQDAIRADRLLVVTFTKAAAAEMRARIEKGMRKEYEKASSDGDSARMRFIKRQEKRLMCAKICTIDAFCQSIVKEYFHLAGVAPSFSVLQSGEMKAAHREVFSEMADRLFAEHNEKFLYLCHELAGCGNEDRDIYALLENLYKFTSSMPYPEKFVKDAAAKYLCDDGYEESGIFKLSAGYCAAQAGKAAKKLEDAAALLPPGEKFSNVREILRAEEAFARELSETDDGAICEAAANAEFATMRFKGEIAAGVKAKIQALRDEAKKIVRQIGDMRQAEDETEAFVSECLYPQMEAIAEIFGEYIRSLGEYKKKHSMLEFSDIEQLCYRIISENESVRGEIRSRFDEILIDEYQDTNELQDGLFSMISNGSDLFMVGDMKQSIYRFRNADVEVFGKKTDSYAEEGENIKLALAHNFRSRGEVLSAVNDVFDKLMTREVGGLEYDDTQRLVLGNKDYTDTGCDYRAECVLIAAHGADDGEKPDAVRSEAEYIVARISRMKKEGFLITDKIRVKRADGGFDEEESVRCVKNSDFAVLMSSHKTAAQIYAEVFEKYGIPISSERSGFFSRPEIRVIMSVLRAIENPERDVDMVALMRSAAGGFTDDELAHIRACERSKSFCAAVFSVYSKYLAKKEEISPAARRLGEKCAELCRRLTRWRDMARYMSAEQMVRMLYEQTGIYALFEVAGDEEATANLRLFCSRAAQAEKNGFCGMFKFLRYMTRLEQNDDDLPGAQTPHEDSVRLMTIHKSKGLEMPVVFVSGCAKKLNLKNDAQYMHKEMGISMDYINYRTGVRIASPAAAVFEDKIRSELKSEELRKLYVAMTRAKEKLIITAALDPDGKDYAYLAGEECCINAEDAAHFIDWVAPVAKASDNWIFTLHRRDESQSGTGAVTICAANEIFAENAEEIIGFKYPYAGKKLKSKASVSEFKNIGGKSDFAAEMPEFMSNDAASGTRYGTAVHRILELLPAKSGEDVTVIAELIETLYRDGEIDARIKKILTPEKIAAFYASDIGRRIAAAEEIRRESEFEIITDAADLYEDESLRGEGVLLQGVIDCWFEEEDGLVLVDYKTDNVRDIDEIHQKYDTQLALYGKALEKITKKRVKDKIIYLFSRDIVVQC